MTVGPEACAVYSSDEEFLSGDKHQHQWQEAATRTNSWHHAKLETVV